MVSAHIASFLKLISAQLEETSRGISSIHHFHNVQCGIENILSLLECNDDVVEKADQLSRRASNYITRHDLISSETITRSNPQRDRQQSPDQAHQPIRSGRPTLIETSWKKTSSLRSSSSKVGLQFRLD